MHMIRKMITFSDSLMNYFTRIKINPYNSENIDLFALFQSSI